MGEFWTTLLCRVALALIESDEFQVLAHHLFHSILSFIVR
jgi:hypothetical protein